MNQICKNLISKSSLLKHAFRSPLCFENVLSNSSQSLKCASSFIILNKNFESTSLSFKRFYVSNTDSNPSFDLKYERNPSSEFKSRERGFYPNRSNTFNKRRNDFGDRLGSKEEDFVDAEPVESTGKQADYSNKEHHGFSDYDIPEKLQARLVELGFNSPFEIQEKTLKHTLAGKDLVGKAFTGSGKTLAFGIPIISRIMKSENKTSRFPKCLVLSPTRELCLQLTKTIQSLAPEMRCLSIVGGTGYESQISALNGKVDIVCATPGRLRDLMNRKSFVPDDIEIICLDEADELLNPNFIEQIHDVIEATNKKQILMFSATISKSVYSLVNKYMKEPVVVDLTDGQKQKLPSNIEHYVVRASRFAHNDIIMHCLEEFKSEKCIVFTNMKRDAIKVNYALSRKGVRSSDLHSDLSQRRREIILQQFRSGKLDVIVATDVAARGIDIPEVNLIVQVGPPSNGVDFYIHRSGRTGRAGRAGKSVLIDDGSKYNFMNMISRLVKFKELRLPSEIQQKVAENQYENDDGEDFRNDSYKKNRFSRGNDRFDRGERFGGDRFTEDRFSNDRFRGEKFPDSNERSYSSANRFDKPSYNRFDKEKSFNKEKNFERDFE